MQPQKIVERLLDSLKDKAAEHVREQARRDEETITTLTEEIFPTLGVPLDTMRLMTAIRRQDGASMEAILKASPNLANARIGDIVSQVDDHLRVNPRMDTVGLAPRVRCLADSTPLLYAVRCGNAQAVEMLIRHGAEKEACCKLGNAFAVHFDTMMRDNATREVLMQHGIDPIFSKTSGEKEIHHSHLPLLVPESQRLSLEGIRAYVEYVEQAAVRKKITLAPTDMDEALVQVNRAPVLEYLISKGADVKRQPDILYTKAGNKVAQYEIEDMKPEALDAMIALLKKHGCKVDFQKPGKQFGQKNDAAFFKACSNNRSHYALALLRAGASPNLPASSGELPFHVLGWCGWDAGTQELRRRVIRETKFSEHSRSDIALQTRDFGKVRKMAQEFDIEGLKEIARSQPQLMAEKAPDKMALYEWVEQQYGLRDAKGKPLPRKEYEEVYQALGVQDRAVLRLSSKVYWDHAPIAQKSGDALAEVKTVLANAGVVPASAEGGVPMVRSMVARSQFLG